MHTEHATGFSRDLQIQSRMRGAVVARVIPVLSKSLGVLRDIHKVIRSNRVAFIV